MCVFTGGIHTECSTYSPVLMEKEDFRVSRGGHLTSDPTFAFYARHSAEVAPLLCA